MSQLEKAIERLRTEPKDYSYEEAAYLLKNLGFQEDNKGKTSGSRVRFHRDSDKRIFLLHKPHPGSIMKAYAVKDFKAFLERIGEL